MGRRVKRDAVTLWFAYRHPNTPWQVKALAAFVVAYALSPIDLIPDFIPVLGYLDDVLLLPSLIWLTIRLLPRDVLADGGATADEWMSRGEGTPRSLWGAALILVLWIGTGVILRQWLGQSSCRGTRDVSQDRRDAMPFRYYLKQTGILNFGARAGAAGS